MITYFARGLRYLKKRLTECAAVDVDIWRNGAKLATVKAIPAKSWRDDAGQAGRRIDAEAVDFLFPVESYSPARGDVIVWQGCRYKIRLIKADKQGAAYSDVYETFMRCEAQYEGEQKC